MNHPISIANLDEDFLKRCRIITRTFQQNQGKWATDFQLLHIYEEIAEVNQAFRRGDIDSIKEELCDVILSTITMFDLLNLPYEEVLQSMEQTLRKVERRSGLLEEKK